jgi:DNA-binding transcriptional regulator YhcF (GntR family)
MERWQNSFDGQSPIYRQIVSRFARSVARGELTPGDRVPSIRDAAVALKVNTNTVQRAYQEMERSQMIFSQRGTGYFLMRDEEIVHRIRAEMVRECTGRFLEEMRTLGFGDAQILDTLREAVGAAGTAGMGDVSADAVTELADASREAARDGAVFLRGSEGEGI